MYVGYFAVLLGLGFAHAGTPTRETAAPPEHIFKACGQIPDKTEASTRADCHCSGEDSARKAFTPMLDRLDDEDLMRKMILPKLMPLIDEQIESRQKLLGCLGASPRDAACTQRLGFMRDRLEAHVKAFRLSLALSQPQHTLADTAIDPNIELPPALRAQPLEPLSEGELKKAHGIQSQTLFYVQSGKKYLGGHTVGEFDPGPAFSKMQFKNFLDACKKDRYPEACRRYRAYRQNLEQDLRVSARAAVARMISDNPFATRFPRVPITDAMLTKELTETKASLQDYREKLRTISPTELILRYPAEWEAAMREHPELCGRLEKRFKDERSKLDARAWGVTLFKFGVSLGCALPVPAWVGISAAAALSGEQTAEMATELMTKQDLYSSFSGPNNLQTLGELQEKRADFVLSVANLPVLAGAAAATHAAYQAAGNLWGKLSEARAVEIEAAIEDGGSSFVTSMVYKTSKTTVDQVNSSEIGEATKEVTRVTSGDGTEYLDTFVYDAARLATQH